MNKIKNALHLYLLQILKKHYLECHYVQRYIIFRSRNSHYDVYNDDHDGADDDNSGSNIERISLDSIH